MMMHQRLAALLMVTGLAAATAAMVLAGCGPEPPARGDDDGDGTGGGAGGGACTPGMTRFEGAIYQACGDGEYADVTMCLPPFVCAADRGCVLSCVGDECGGGEDCAGEARLIYVVTNESQLMSFQPANDAHTFAPIGQLACPAGNEWPERGGDPSHPYSMSVDRSGTAWVHYTSGEVFRVSTANASCSATAFSPDVDGFELFGMGFVADSPGSISERLFVAGGLAEAPQDGNLGTFDLMAMTTTARAPLVRGEFQPELSGTGNGELYAYYPGQQSSYVARLDPASADIVQTWSMPPLTGIPIAWAFAHWGGRLYVFVTDLVVGVPGAPNSKVYRLDPATGQVDLVREHLPFRIVGAGVSTCAPVVIE